MHVDQFNRELLAFLAAASTPFHAVSALVSRLQSAGFRALQSDQSWSLEPGGRYYLTRNDSSIVAFTVGSEAAPEGGMRMVGAHTDSPCLMVKPAPEKRGAGYFQLGVEVYGGALVIPSLAIHLDREANQSRSINPQTDILPVLALQAEPGTPSFRELLRDRLLMEQPDCAVREVLDYELCFYDTQPPALVGLHEEFIASARLDNLLSCFTGLQSLLAADGRQSCLLVCNDHEEVGSLSTSGAQGPLLLSTLRRLVPDEVTLAQLVANSLMISADNAHGIHPNYADKHDDNHGPLLNAGPVIKINANQRYATNAETAGLFRLLAKEEGVAVQSFVVRSDMGCGSTIGPITAGGTGIRTLDIGVPTFAMHSVRELAGRDDAAHLCRVLQRFYNHSGRLTPA